MGKLGTSKRVASLCRNLNLFKNKATVNPSVADTYRFTRKYLLLGGIHN